MTRIVTSGPRRLSKPSSRPPLERWLIGLSLFTGLTALAGGLLLIAAPDGSLLRMDSTALKGSPFSDWRVPGVLLAVLVGIGFLLAAHWVWRRRRGAQILAAIGGGGLILFEAAEFAWIGFQPLEAVFAGVGIAVVVLALSRHSTPATPRRHDP